MTSPSPRTPWDCRICRCIAVAALALAALNPSFFSSRAGVLGMVFGAQSGDAAPPPTRTSPPTRTPSSKQAPTKPSETQDSRPRLNVKSKIALVVDANTSEELLVKNADQVVPIASITKLMTAMVVLDAKLPLGEMLKISNDDRDLVMGTISRLRVGWALSREDMLHLALMSSENRAAAALSRYYPGGRPAFIQAMNAKATELGMTQTHFVNPNGLTNENVSTAFDLAKLVRVADQYPLIREFTTDPRYDVRIGRYILPYINTNRLVGRPDWNIEVQKTGFTNEAGDCVVMRVNAEGRSLIMIFLDANGKLTRFADAHRVLMQLALLQKK
jgi:D-alanyl-D-alanine endopeptidase (penicillin-binding protein 7)